MKGEGHRAPGRACVCALVLGFAGAQAFGQSIVSDDFNTCTLDTAVWTLVDPLGGGSAVVAGMGTQDAQLLIHVPGGATHDVWSDGNNAVRVLQAVPNTDFEVQVKFDSAVTAPYQMQGLLVEQDATRLFRFDAYSDGTNTYLFSATIDAETAVVRRELNVPNVAPMWLGIQRAGDNWTLQYSTNGSDWTPFTTFAFPMTVTAIGPYAGNYSPGVAPAHTARVDYFLNVADPLSPEDGTPEGTPATLTTSVTGEGTIEADPPMTNFYCGETVTLTAVPAPGWILQNWSGDLSGTELQQTLTMTESRTVVAHFVPDGLAPVITNVQIAPTLNSATVSWTTDVPATSRVRYGKTTAYELGAVTSDTLVTTHALTLTGLDMDTEYHVQISSADAQGEEGQTADIVFRTVGNALGVVSDDFNVCALNTAVWTVVDPVGGGSAVVKGIGSDEAFLEIFVPGGASHDLWTDGNHSVRALQNAADVDFEVRAKFLSQPNAGYQMQGIMVEQDAQTFLRFDAGFNGSSAFMFSATFGPGQATVRGNQAIPSAGPIWLSVIREGNQWTLRYSFNGTSWTTHATFAWSVDVNRVGPFAGNYNPGVAPAFTCRVDWFENATFPLVVEDGPITEAAATITRTVTGNGQIEVQPLADAYYCDEVVTVTAVPEPGWAFTGWGGDLSGTTNPTTLVMSSSKTISATFEPDNLAPVISDIRVVPGMYTARIHWQTDSPARSLVQYGTTSAYEMGEVVDPTFTMTHVVELTGLQPEREYHFKITAVDSGGDTGQTGDLTFVTPNNPTGLVSDDFNHCSLDTGVWTLVDPLGGATVQTVGTGSLDAHLLIHIPGGASRDSWVGYNNSVRLMQPAIDTDFDVELKTESQPNAGFQREGLFIEQDNDNWLRYDVQFDGTTTSLFAAVVRGNSARVLGTQNLPSSRPIWLGIRRAGNSFTLRYSLNGSSWSNLTSTTEVLEVNAVGIAAGNSSTGSAPAYTARLDYFLVEAAPFADEDGPRPGNPSHLVMSVNGNGTIEKTPDSPAYYCQEKVTVRAVPRPGWLFSEWTGDVTGTTNPIELDMSSSYFLTANFVVNPSILVSDDFNACSVNTGLWQVINPGGAATISTKGTGSDSATLRFFIPAGPSRDIEPSGNRSPRLIQPANDTTFEIRVKFDSDELVSGQLQGVLVEGTNNTYLRFDFRNTDGQSWAVATSVVNGSASARSIVPITDGSPSYMSVYREGDEWVLQHSLDGVNWTPAGSFSFPLVVTGAGPFAGTMGSPAPEFLCKVDYFFNQASPIDPEDGTPAGGTPAELVTTIVGEGTVVVDPPTNQFYCNETVTLTAEPALGWLFEEWGGDLSGSEPVKTLAMTESRNVEATFVMDLRNIEISNLKIIPTETSVKVTWRTNKLTTTSLMYGITEYSPVISLPGYRTNHAIEITDLMPNTLYWIAINCTDPLGKRFISTDYPFYTLMPGGFNSDDFNAFNLNGRIWRMVDPMGDSEFSFVGTNTPDARLRIQVPGGLAHSITGDALNAPRVMQNASNVDIGMEVKFESVINRAYQMQGLLIQQDDRTFIRSEFYSNGSGILLLVATFQDGQMEIVKNQPLSLGFPWYMRVIRTGDHWDVLYCNDGTSWTSGASFDFPMTVTAVGPFIANEGAPAPTFTGLIDYFFNLVGPIDPEDGTFVQDTNPPNLTQINTLVDEVTVTVTWLTDEPSTSVILYGETTEYEAGVYSDSNLTTVHVATITGLKENATYHLKINSADSSGNIGESDDIVVQTTRINHGPTMNVWYGLTQEFGHLGMPQPAINILGNVADPVDGVASLVYSLNNGPPRTLSLGPDLKRLTMPGDFNVDIPFASLLPGNNEVVFTATDLTGKTSTTVVTVVNSSGSPWPLPCTVDWSQATTPNDVAQVVDGEWVCEADSVRPTVLAYDRLIALGDLTWTDYEVTVPVTVRSIDPLGYNAPSFGPGVGLVFRWPGHSDDGAQPASGVYPLGAIGMYRWTDTYERFQLFGNEGAILASAPLDQKLELGKTYIFRMRVETLPEIDRSRYYLKYWLADEYEPYEWNIVGDQRNNDDPKAGSVLLLAHHVDASFGAVIARPGPFQDSPPVVISNVEAAPLDYRVTITWQTSEPARTRFKYGVTSSYELQTLFVDELTTEHSVSLTGLQPGTEYHYEIVAISAEGIGVTTGDLTFTTTVGCEVDSDNDGTVDCKDGCPLDAAKLEPGICGCGVAETACNALPELPTGWVGTAANNSLAEDPSLFGMHTVNGETVFGTVSTASNIHAHYVGPLAYTWTNYEYSGAMMITSPSGGIGVTLFSDFPNSDSYYRLRRYTGYSFHMAPHPNGIVMMSYGTTDSGVVPEPNVWYSFRMRAQRFDDYVRVQAKVWPEGTTEPSNWQVDCVDTHANRLLAGTAGVWCMGSGAKYWKNLRVQLIGDSVVLDYSLPDFSKPAQQFPDPPALQESWEVPSDQPAAPRQIMRPARAEPAAAR